ncbi:hypothetical protein G4B88_015097, partial [Cannabis sativa]
METALHVAAGANQLEFVEMLINDEDIDLTYQDIHGNTAFCSAVIPGAIRIVQKFLTLPNLSDYFIKTRGSQNMSPLFIASWFGQLEVTSLLYQHTNAVDIEAGEKFGVYFNCIKNDMFELAIKMIEDNAAIDIAHQYDTNKETALH